MLKFVPLLVAIAAITYLEWIFRVLQRRDRSPGLVSVLSNRINYPLWLAVGGKSVPGLEQNRSASYASIEDEA